MSDHRLNGNLSFHEEKHIIAHYSNPCPHHVNLIKILVVVEYCKIHFFKYNSKKVKHISCYTELIQIEV